MPDHWMIPLEHKPDVVVASVGHHGRWPIERFRLHGLWIVHMYHDPADLYLDGEKFEIGRGCACVVAPGVDMEYHFKAEQWSDRYAYFTVLPEIGQSVPISVVQDLGSDFDEVNDQFERAIGCHRTRPQWAEAKIWDILWNLADRSAADEGNPSGTHPALRKAIDLIEGRLADPSTAPQLAEQAGVSYTHLAFLFQRTLGMTISQYVRRRRIERAEHLLQFSTLSIKAIATQIGCPDLHVFNKMVRKERGMSPTDVRRNAPPWILHSDE